MGLVQNLGKCRFDILIRLVQTLVKNWDNRYKIRLGLISLCGLLDSYEASAELGQLVQNWGKSILGKSILG